MERETAINSINTFQSVYDDYFKALTQYMMGEFVETHEYKFLHPTLFDLAIKLNVSFYGIPEELRKRLLMLDFEAFLHCNNQVDFFSFRIFLSKNNRFQKLATIANRVDAEVKTAILFLESDIFSEYAKLPAPNHNFYRDYYINTDLLKELELEKQIEEVTHKSESKSEFMSDTDQVVSLAEKKNPFTEYNDNLKKGEEILSNTNNFVDKLKYSITLIKDIYKLFN